MGEELIRVRCYNHARREAAACCPTCGRHFCRECVTEHEGRVVCASCLAAQAAPVSRRRSALRYAARALRIMLALFALYFFFYALGAGLLALPTSFHQGTLWEDRK
jgi:hypothetical protein